MSFWLLKSEPGAWSWDDQVRARVTEWDGVRNYQARNNLQAMKTGDRAFFYHSGDERRVVGIVEVVRQHYPDPGDPSGRFVMVDVKAVAALPRPVTLQEIKDDDKLGHLLLVRNSRLSVMPVDAAAWRRICRLGGVKG